MKAWYLSAFDFEANRTRKYRKPIINNPTDWMNEKAAFLKGVYHFDKCEVMNTRPGGYVLICTRAKAPRRKAMEIHFYLRPVNVDGKRITFIHEQ